MQLTYIVFAADENLEFWSSEPSVKQRVEQVSLKQRQQRGELTPPWAIMEDFLVEAPSKLRPEQRMSGKTAHAAESKVMAPSGNRSSSERWQQSEERAGEEVAFRRQRTLEICVEV